MPKSQPGRTFPTYVDAETVRAAELVARAENRKPAQLGGEALALWINLPPSARAAFRFIRGVGEEVDLRNAYREVARALLGVQRTLTTERAAAELRQRFPGLDASLTEEEILDSATAIVRATPESDQGSAAARRPRQRRQAG